MYATQMVPGTDCRVGVTIPYPDAYPYPFAGPQAALGAVASNTISAGAAQQQMNVERDRMARNAALMQQNMAMAGIASGVADGIGGIGGIGAMSAPRPSAAGAFGLGAGAPATVAAGQGTGVVAGKNAPARKVLGKNLAENAALLESGWNPGQGKAAGGSGSKAPAPHQAGASPSPNQAGQNPNPNQASANPNSHASASHENFQMPTGPLGAALAPGVAESMGLGHLFNGTGSPVVGPMDATGVVGGLGGAAAPRESRWDKAYKVCAILSGVALLAMGVGGYINFMHDLS